jgi:hypothetical protein
MSKKLNQKSKSRKTKNQKQLKKDTADKAQKHRNFENQKESAGKSRSETTYIKDKKTGLYICVNPSGSTAYNYLYGRESAEPGEDDKNRKKKCKKKK